MKITLCKILSLVLTIALMVVVLPMSTWAEEANDSRMLATMDKMWAMLDEAEGESIETYGEKGGAKTVEDMLEAVRNNPYVDQSSIDDIDDNGFSFDTIDGLACCYDYRIRTAKDSDSSENYIQTVSYANRVSSATSANVLLIGPYYGSDSSFTNQYKNEAQALAELLGGTYTLLSGTGANATTICENFADQGIIFFDSHGSSCNDTSYLCLESSAGISASDYSDDSAINGGDWWGIDGRFIKKHMEGTIAGSLIWMAICEGMMTDGMATPLRSAGAGVVYGYSQSVSFSGDYEYEEYFYEYMKDGRTVAEAATYMKQEVGNMDPYTSPHAYPIFVSATDSYPSNPDSVQTVHSDWVLPMDSEVTSISPKQLTLQYDPSGNFSVTGSESITVRVRNYTPTAYEWSVEDETVVRIAREKLGVVTVAAVSAGTSNVSCKVYNGANYKEVSCSVTVDQVGQAYVLTDEIVPNEDYLIAATSGTKTYLMNNTVYSTTIGTFGFDFLRASEAVTSTMGDYFGTADDTECIYMITGNKPISASLRWRFSNVPTASTYSFIQNVETDESLTRYEGGNYTDLFLNTQSSSKVAQRWYYQNNGLFAKSDSNTDLAYIAFVNGETPHFQASNSTNGEANTNVVAVKLYRLVKDIPISYTITFDAGEHGTVTESERVVAAGEAIGTLPTVEAERGWDFAGWYTDSDTEVTVATVPTGNMTIHAEYTPHPTYTITFDAGEHGTVNERERSVYAGEAIGTLPTVEAERGWDFAGWYTGSDTEVTATTIPTGSMTIYAEYTPHPTYTVTFDAGENGTVTESERSVLAGEAIGTLPTVEAERGWDFAGWYTDSDTEVTATTIPTGNMTLHAEYTEKAYNMVNFTVNGTTTELKVYVGTKLNELLTPDTTPADGLAFVGWMIDGIVVASDYEINAAASFAAAFAIVAQDSELNTVILLPNSGTIENDTWTQTDLGEPMLLPEPTKAGNTFRAWFDGENYYCAGASYLPQKDSELVALWVETDDECTHSYGEGSCTLCGANLLGDADCDGTITAADSSKILRSVVKLDTLRTLGILNADVDATKAISAADAAIILRYIVHLIPMLGN